MFVFLAATLIIGAFAGLLTGLLFRESQLQTLKAKLRRHTGGKLKGSDEEDAALWDAATSSDEESSDFNNMNDAKMVLCVRTDLGMGKGKMCAQAGHAVLGLYERCHKRKYAPLEAWRLGGQRKVALKVTSQGEMNALYAAATQSGLPAYIVHDAGRTQIAAGSATVLSIGPAADATLDKITGHLKLL